MSNNLKLNVNFSPYYLSQVFKAEVGVSLFIT